MKPISGKEFTRILEQHGWVLMRIRGSHHIYGKSGVVVRLSVPVHGNKELKAGLLMHFLKIANLPEDVLK